MNKKSRSVDKQTQPNGDHPGLAKNQKSFLKPLNALSSYRLGIWGTEAHLESHGPPKKSFEGGAGDLCPSHRPRLPK